MANEFKIKKGLIVNGSGGTLLDVQGSVGQVFSVTDSLTGDIFSVSDVSGIPIFNVNSDGTVTIDGNIQLADDNKIQLGDDQDLELYHDGTHSYIKDNGTGELRFIANGATRFKIGSDVASFSGTDFAIAATRKLYLDGQSNTYITESSADTIKIFTGGSEVLELANNSATFAGAISTPTGSTFAGAIKITETGTAQHILIGNQDSGGTDKPAMIRGVNGELKLGYGSSWSSEGGTMSVGLTLDAASDAVFSGDVKIDGSFKWATSNATSYTYSNADASGLYIETVGSTAALSDMRFQARAAGSGNYSSINIKPSNQSILLNTNGSTRLTIDSNGYSTFAGRVYVGENFIMSGSSPTISFLNTNTNADDFYIHISSNNFYILTNRTNSPADQVDTGWETPHPLQLEADTNTGYLFGDKIFDEAYHPNADKWTSARTITLGGDLSGSVSIDGSANVTLTAAVANNSHNHDGRYYTETETNNKFTSTDGSGNEWKFKLGDEGNLSGNKWYKVAQMNQGSGGLQIKGFLSNHVETFGTQQFDLAIQGRETNTEIEITGVVNVLHNATAVAATDKVGIRVVKSDTTSSGSWHYWDVYIRTARYTQADIHIIKSGSGNSFYTTKPSVTSEPAPVSGGTVEIDTSTYAEGNYMISNSSPVLTAKTTGTTVVGTLTAAGDVIAYSDLSLKENIKTLDGSKVLQMRGVSFNRKNNGILSSGVIAQEMQQVAPELVSDDNGTLGVAYGNLTGYLIEAIKEQQKQIDELKSQMTACNKTVCNCNCKK